MSLNNYSRKSVEAKELLSDLVSISGLSSVGKRLLIRTLRYKYAPEHPLIRYFGAGDLVAHYFRIRSQPKKFQTGDSDQAFEQECWYRGNSDLEAIGRLNHNWIAGQMAHVFAPRGFHVKLIRPVEKRVEEMLLQGRDITAAQLEREDADLAARFEERFPGCSWVDEDFDLVLDMGMPINTVVEAIVLKHYEWQVSNAWKTSFYA